MVPVTRASPRKTSNVNAAAPAKVSASPKSPSNRRPAARTTASKLQTVKPKSDALKSSPEKATKTVPLLSPPRTPRRKAPQQQKPPTTPKSPPRQRTPAAAAIKKNLKTTLPTKAAPKKSDLVVTVDKKNRKNIASSLSEPKKRGRKPKTQLINESLSSESTVPTTFADASSNTIPTLPPYKQVRFASVSPSPPSSPVAQPRNRHTATGGD
ncbi:hypothetical protein HK100_000361, partial [Physocladia obscura]